MYVCVCMCVCVCVCVSCALVVCKKRGVHAYDHELGAMGQQKLLVPAGPRLSLQTKMKLLEAIIFHVSLDNSGAF
jgi:hypothetical protein